MEIKLNVNTNFISAVIEQGKECCKDMNDMVEDRDF